MSAMRPQRIVILGGTGFVGRALTEKLAKKRHDVLVLSRNVGAHREAPLPGGVKLIDVDVYDEAQLAQKLQGANVAINLVGILNEPGRNGSGFRKAHVELTRTLVRACEHAHVPRLLQMSALNAGTGESHYLKTRGEAELIVRSSPLAWTIFRPSVIFGPGDGLFSRFANLLGLLPALPLARADARFAPVYVGDVAEAMVRAIENDETITQTYELGGPRVMTLREIVKYTAAQLGVTRAVVPLPNLFGRMQAMAMDFVPGKPFSTDNYLSLGVDSIPHHDGLAQLGITPTTVESVVPQYLGRTQQRTYDRYRSRDQ
jgi:uncharacterized protein YbjT (DUF2867 family)